MLTFNEQYDLAGGIFYTFKTKKANKRLLSISHGKQKRDKMKKIFPHKQYELWTKENFIVALLYINFTKNPSSMETLINELKEIDEKYIIRFKNEIIHYRKHLLDDIERLKIEEGTNISFSIIKEKYRKNEIKWFTFYFFTVVKGINTKELEKSRIDGFLYNNIKKLLLYVTFSEKSMMEVKTLMQDTIEI